MTSADSEFSSARNAVVYDVTQPYIFDNSCFASLIREELGSYAAPTIMECGCGTGLLALKLLRALEHCDYYGIDASVEMLAVFKRHLASLDTTDRMITLVAPVDLRMRAAVSALLSRTLDVVLMSQFLQYIPLRACGEGQLNKEEFLAQCLAITRAGGRVFIIEDVCGESPVEHLELSNAWDAEVLARYAENLRVIEAGLNDVDPAFVHAIRQMITHPSLLRIFREKRRAARSEEIVPLSTWKRLLANTGRAYRVCAHASLRNFYMFIVEC